MKTDKAKLIQLIHIAKSELHIDDFSYRQMLQRLASKKSSTECSIPELHQILSELQAKGSKVKWFAKRGKKTTAYSPQTGSTPVKSQITHKIRAIWITMGKQGFLKDGSEKALNTYARKLFNKKRTTLLLNVGALGQDEANKLLEILKKWHKRVMQEALIKAGFSVNPKASYDNTVDYYAECKGAK